MLLALLVTITTIAQPAPNEKTTPAPLPKVVGAPKREVPLFQAPPSPLAQTTHALPQGPSITPTLDLLSKEVRRVVETESHYCRRFPDGSVWTNHAATAARELMCKPGPARSDQAGAPWQCLSSPGTAQNEDEIFDAIDAAKARSMLAAQGIKFYDGRVLQVLRDGLLIAIVGDVSPRLETVLVVGHPLHAEVVDNESVSLSVKEIGRYQYEGIFGTRTVVKMQWAMLQGDYKCSRATEPVSAEELALAAYNGEIPRQIPQWRIVPCVLRPATCDEAGFVGSDQYGHTSPALYHNAVYGWRIDRSDRPLAFKGS